MVPPVFADIEGTLGETYNKDKGEQEFTLGVKLKLNGSFRTYSSVFRYYLTLLDPSSQEHKERKSRENIHQRAFIEKVLKLALLYYFVFRNMDDTIYDPTRDVEAELLVDLSGLKVTPFERIVAVVAHGGDLFRSFLPTVADQLFLCNTALLGRLHFCRP